MSDQHLMTTYNRANTAFENGQGSWLFDTDGNKYLDLISGIAVCGLGHCHPAVTQAVRDQAGRLVHTSNLYQIPLQNKLASLLANVSGMDSVFFCNSGAEANEAAIKLARLYGHQRKIQNPCIVVMEGAFHGRTMATLSATGSRKAQAGFEPLVGGFIRAPFDDVEAIRNIAKNNPDVVAVLLEPIIGEGGVRIPDADYLPQLRKICDEHQWLMMLDEVQTGNGRTGSYFAYQQQGFAPDVVTTAKGLGNGFPIGACLARGTAAQLFKPGSHGSTFGGTPLACAAAIATVETIISQKLPERAARLGAHMVQQLKKEMEQTDYVREIRGAGMMIGIELDFHCTELVVLARAKGLLINVTADSVIRLLPPLTLTEPEAELAVRALVQLIKVYAADERAGDRRTNARDGSDRRLI